MKNFKSIITHTICIFIGVFLTYTAIVIWSIFSWFIWGFEIQSVLSFPHHHQAKLYSRPGFGDQTFTFWVNNKLIWDSGDAAPGNLQEKIYWDKSGNIVTLELESEKIVVFDATNLEIKHSAW